MKEYRRLGGWNNTHWYITVLEAGKSKIKVPAVWCLVCCRLWIADFWSPCILTFSFTRDLPSRPNHCQEAPPPNPSHWGSGAEHRNLEGTQALSPLYRVRARDCIWALFQISEPLAALQSVRLAFAVECQEEKWCTPHTPPTIWLKFSLCLPRVLKPVESRLSRWAEVDASEAPWKPMWGVQLLPYWAVGSAEARFCAKANAPFMGIFSNCLLRIKICVT